MPSHSCACVNVLAADTHALSTATSTISCARCIHYLLCTVHPLSTVHSASPIYCAQCIHYLLCTVHPLSPVHGASTISCAQCIHYLLCTVHPLSPVHSASPISCARCIHYLLCTVHPLSPVHSASTISCARCIHYLLCTVHPGLVKGTHLQLPLHFPQLCFKCFLEGQQMGSFCFEQVISFIRFLHEISQSLRKKKKKDTVLSTFSLGGLVLLIFIEWTFSAKSFLLCSNALSSASFPLDKDFISSLVF